MRWVLLRPALAGAVIAAAVALWSLWGPEPVEAAPPDAPTLRVTFNAQDVGAATVWYTFSGANVPTVVEYSWKASTSETWGRTQSQVYRTGGAGAVRIPPRLAGGVSYDVRLRGETTSGPGDTGPYTTITFTMPRQRPPAVGLRLTPVWDAGKSKYKVTFSTGAYAGRYASDFDYFQYRLAKVTTNQAAGTWERSSKDAVLSALQDPDTEYYFQLRACYTATPFNAAEQCSPTNDMSPISEGSEGDGGVYGVGSAHYKTPVAPPSPPVLTETFLPAGTDDVAHNRLRVVTSPVAKGNVAEYQWDSKAVAKTTAQTAAGPVAFLSAFNGQRPLAFRVRICAPARLGYTPCSGWVSLSYRPPLPTPVPTRPPAAVVHLGGNGGGPAPRPLGESSETLSQVREALDVGHALRAPFTNIPAFAAWAFMVVAFMWMVVVRPKFNVPPYVGILATFVFAITVSQILQLHILTSAVLAACAVVPAFWVYKQRRAF